MHGPAGDPQAQTIDASESSEFPKEDLRHVLDRDPALVEGVEVEGEGRLMRTWA